MAQKIGVRRPGELESGVLRWAKIKGLRWAKLNHKKIYLSLKAKGCI